MGLKENNRVRTFGVIPAYDGDPIPVRLVTEDAGAGMKENNRVRTFGVIPTEGADPIPVSGMLYPSPISIPPSAFIPSQDDYDWEIWCNFVKKRTGLGFGYYTAPVFFPHGVTVTEFTLYGYRDAAVGVMTLELRRISRVGGTNIMATVAAGWVTGWSSGADDSIDFAVVNNFIYSYGLTLLLDPNTGVGDVQCSGARIAFTA